MQARVQDKITGPEKIFADDNGGVIDDLNVASQRTTIAEGHVTPPEDIEITPGKHLFSKLDSHVPQLTLAPGEGVKLGFCGMDELCFLLSQEMQDCTE